MSVVQKARVSGRHGLAEALTRLFGDQRVGGLVVAGYDQDFNLCGVAVDSRHHALSWVKVWELAALAEALDATSLVVAVFPSGPALAPTAHELSVFADLMVRTRPAGFVLLDCLVYRDDRLWSLRGMQGGRVGA